MFNELHDIFKKTLELATIRHRIEDEYRLKSVSLTDFNELEDFYKSNEGRIVKESRCNLDNLLNSLDYEAIKVMQVIMYVGRDKDFDQLDTPMKIYQTCRRYFDKKGWDSKEIEANQMSQKIPLDNYLRAGFQILEIII